MVFNFSNWVDMINCLRNHIVRSKKKKESGCGSLFYIKRSKFILSGIYYNKELGLSHSIDVSFKLKLLPYDMREFRLRDEDLMQKHWYS